ncbi:hypothetical protein [Crenobacter intestini]|uniref:Uncharacterized protein n=1 Tax=Crenobacter intestini TaxID=2563443 RepID=A0A4V4N7K7_9NEIS|nr:hypothetical protein [Crenobacter intestini]TIC80293.1 hypothetical protein E5K04_12360 [Crenobacter intestini]
MYTEDLKEEFDLLVQDFSLNDWIYLLSNRAPIHPLRDVVWMSMPEDVLDSFYALYALLNNGWLDDNYGDLDVPRTLKLFGRIGWNDYVYDLILMSPFSGLAILKYQIRRWDSIQGVEEMGWSDFIRLCSGYIPIEMIEMMLKPVAQENLVDEWMFYDCIELLQYPSMVCVSLWVSGLPKCQRDRIYIHLWRIMQDANFSMDIESILSALKTSIPRFAFEDKNA